MVVFSMWDPANPVFEVDLFVREPFDFEAAYRRRVEISTGRTRMSVVALDDLLALKREAGRKQDVADIEALLALHSGDE
jgi:predicted nucleotidyltransferase